MIPVIIISVSLLVLALGIYALRHGCLMFFGGFLVSCSLPVTLWASGLGGGATAIFSGIPLLYGWAGLSIKREYRDKAHTLREKLSGRQAYSPERSGK